MEISNDKLFAYLDGKTTSAEAREIKEAAARIPEIARRLERLRRLNQAASDANRAKDNTPVPVKVATPRRTGRAAGTGRNKRFPSGRKSNAFGWSMSLAASVATLAGFGFGALVVSYLWESSQQGPAESMTGVIDSPSPLFAVLESSPSGRPVALGQRGDISVLPILTFKGRTGAYCREYIVTSRRALTRGLACRENDAWSIKAIAAQPRHPAASPDRYTTASGESLALFDDFVDRLKGGDPLSAEAEQDLIRNGWN